MESIGFFQDSFIIIIIMILLYMCSRSLRYSSSTSSSTYSSSSSSSSSVAAAADTNITCFQEKYDVFISFRGEDTRLTFTSHLYDALCRKKIETYIDYRLVRGWEIAPALLEAIERSTLSVIIFSKNYASSTWCLEELVHILECKDKNGQLVIPIFFDISPSDVRKQQGSYALAFRQLEKRFEDNIDKVHKWRAALTQAANLSGFDHSDKTESEASLVKKVVQDVWTKLNRESSSDLKGLVGIKWKIEQIESLLCFDLPGVCYVGIWGMGGIGKTTLADVVFHRLSSEFEAACFLANVREESEKHGLNHLRNKLLREILKDEDLNIDTPSIGSTFTRERISRTKALIVLDDVNALSQLEFLVGDHDQFCSGSLIIITTRDRSLLEERVDDDKIYEVERLSPNEALQLFQSHAFKNKSPKADFSELSRKVVHYVKGIPLALKTLGPLFLPHKRIEDWEEELSKLKKFPNEEILSVLRHSYNGLEKNEKEIFLDIACFYKGMDMDFVIKMIHLHGFYAVGIKVLIAKSLISISTSNCLEMHDMLQEMGWAIVREQCIEEPGKRDRLWDAEDVCHVLENNTGTATVRSISFHPTATTKLSAAAAFQNMYNLRLLKIYDPHLSSKHDFKLMDIKFNYINRMLKDCGLSFQLSLSLMFNTFDLSQGLESLPDALRYLHWLAYPLKSLPTKFSMKNLVELRMPCSKVVGQIWSKGQKLRNLKVIDLSYCKHLTEVPDLSWSSNLEHIDLCECTSLVQIPSYFQNFHKLTYLDLGGCLNLNYLPEMPVNIESLDLSKTAIKELPSSVWSLEKLCSLNVTHCKALEKLPSNSCNLKVSGTFSLKGCESLGEFSELPRYTSDLDLSETAIKELPSSLESLFGLTTIRLFACDSLLSLSTSIHKLKSLESLDLHLCSEFQYFPEILEPMEHLTSLSLSCTAVKVLPSSIGNLIGLRKLDLHDCEDLEVVPNSIYNLSNLETLNFHGCWCLGKLPPVSVDQVRLLSLKELILAGCGIKEIPDALVCLTSLCSLDLKDTKIKSIPASIKQAAQLSSLYLTYCQSLESLPELPPLLQCLEAGRCTSLKKVSSSRTALTQGWDVFSPPRLEEKRIFSGCPQLDENARSNIMADAQLRIMRMATASSKFKEEASYDSDDSYDEYEPDNRNELKEHFYWGSFVAINCSGYDIPNWFSHQNEGSSINIKLPPDWFRTDFLGFALSVVVYSNNNAGWLDCGYKYTFDIGCKYNFKTSNGESHEINHPFYSPYPYVMTSVDSHELFVWWYNNVFQVVGGAEIPTAFYKLVTEASVDFSLKQYHRKPFPELEVVKCGICLLYAQEAEIIKQRNL